MCRVELLIIFRSVIAYSKVRQPFASFTISTGTYTAVLDRLTDETFILVLTRPSIRESNRSYSAVKRHAIDRSVANAVPSATEPAAIELNIKLARPHFSKLESIGVSK